MRKEEDSTVDASRHLRCSVERFFSKRRLLAVVDSTPVDRPCVYAE